jgi:hypothetical protein
MTGHCLELNHEMDEKKLLKKVTDFLNPERMGKPFDPPARTPEKPGGGPH